MKRRISSLSFVLFAFWCSIPLMLTSCKEEFDDMKQDKAPEYIKAVDLGLSVKWANCNMGAVSPEGIGDHYAWGETEMKGEYNSSTYEFYLGDLNGNGKDNESEEYQDIGSDISGTDYDVAHVKWGGNWRMPTEEEFEELAKKCSWNGTEINGVKGKLVTGPNGNSIFLPCTGMPSSADSTAATSIYGIYWSATLGIPRAYAVCLLFIYNDIVSGDRCWNARRDIGLVVRPVMD